MNIKNECSNNLQINERINKYILYDNEPTGSTN